MKIDATLDPDTQLADVPAIARAAEATGFDGLWTAETRHDPFLPLALAAEHTQRLELGTAVAVAFARSPTSVAHLAWDLAAASRGRFILGLGSQVRAHVTRRFGASWSGRPVSQLRDYVVAVRAVWANWQDGTPLRLRSEHYPLSLMTPFFNPGPIDHPRIPIYLAGVGTPMARLAGEVADGLVVHPLHSPAYLTDVLRPAIATGARAADRDPAEIALSASVMVATADAERESTRSQVAFYASTPSYRPVFEHHGWGAAADELSTLARRGGWEAMASVISDQMLETFVVVAAPAALGETVARRCAGLVDRLSLYRPLVPGVDDDGWRALVAAVKAAA